MIFNNIRINNVKKFLILNLFLQNIYAQEQVKVQSNDYLANAEKYDQAELMQHRIKDKKLLEEFIEFNFKDKKLIDLIDMLARKRGINYIIPQNKAQQEKFKAINISYQPIDQKDISLEKAWELATLFLELSGFAWFKRSETIYQITSNASDRETRDNITKELLPLYVNTKIEDLPNDDSRIRYIYYFTNLKVPENDKDPLNQIFNEMKSEGAPKPFVLNKYNGVLLIDKANVIASIVNLISKLDATGFRETIEVVQLHNISATEVQDTFDKLKKAAGPENTSPFIRADTKASISFFASDTQIIPDIRNNSIILMGREAAVTRIRDFINSYMDTPGESGKSVLHYYNLQYLEAKDFAVTLSQILASSTTKSQGKEANLSNIERQFEGVIVVAEKKTKIKKVIAPYDNESVRPGGRKSDALGIQGEAEIGGNRLIIAATQDDWIEIEKLIKKLDQPQPQVILEVLVADISHQKNKIISGDIRSRRMDELTNGFGFMSSNISNVNSITPDHIKTLATDLLGQPRTNSNPNSPNNPILSSLLTTGNFILSFSDPTTPQAGYSTTGSTASGAIWALIRILDLYVDMRIMTHPFLVSFDNTKAAIKQSIVKRNRGDSNPSQSGVIAVNIDDIPASIQVEMVPRISSENRLSLQVAVDISDFNEEGDNAENSLTRKTRRVETLVNLNSGNVLVIGGLTNVTETDIVTGTPFFSQIPLIGRFFQGIIKTLNASNIAIFISPTIVMPRLRDGLHLHTRDKLTDARSRLNDSEVYGDNRDPITYFFLPNRDSNMNLVNEYLEQTANESEYKKEATVDLIKKEENRKETEQIIKDIKQTENIDITGMKSPEKLYNLEKKNLTDVPA